MKNFAFCFLFAVSFSYAQVNDVNNYKAADINNNTLSGNIGVGLGVSTPQLMLSIGDNDSGIVGSDNQIDLYTASISRLSIDSFGNIDVFNEFRLNYPDMTAILKPTGLSYQNKFTGGGWSRELLEVTDTNDSRYWTIGGYGSGQSHTYGYIGQDYNDKAISWDSSNNVGIGLPTTYAPLLMLSLGDNDSGLVGGLGSFDIYTNNISRFAINSTGEIEISGNVNVQNEDLSSKIDKGILMTNHELVNGWAYNLLGIEDNSGSDYWQVGAWGDDQLHYYGFIGAAYDNKVLNWNNNNQLGVGLPTTASPGLMLSIGDIDSGIVGGSDTLNFYTGNVSSLSIDASQNVGIGTTTPDEKLAVNGKIHAQEVRVDLTGWPDYVFNEDYQLDTLEEIEKFIEKNGHLPDVPNAQDIEENGLSLGAINAKLMEKIEELTLYAIQQHKIITNQSETNEKLEQRLRTLEALILDNKED